MLQASGLQLQAELQAVSFKLAKLLILVLLLICTFILFYDFDSSPIAAASIAQVYSAKLKENNKAVAIKVVRPGIKKIIERDISLMKRMESFEERK